MLVTVPSGSQLLTFPYILVVLYEGRRSHCLMAYFCLVWGFSPSFTPTYSSRVKSVQQLDQAEQPNQTAATLNIVTFF